MFRVAVLALENCMQSSVTTPVDILTVAGLEDIQGANILLVEDNELNRDVAKELLALEGFWVSVAENGKKAVNMIAENRSRNGELSYDAVLMDLMMPELDGYEATRQIRKLEKEWGASGIERIPIIAMTADAMSGVRQDVMEAGMDDYVPKPIDPDQLLSTLVKWIQPGERERGIPAETDPSDELATPFPKLDGINTAKGIARVSRSRSFYQKLLIKFRQRNLDTHQKIRNALEDKDMETAILLVHTLKGISGTIGAEALQKAALDFETAIREQDRAIWDDLFATLDHSLSTVLSAIESLENQLADASDEASKTDYSDAPPDMKQISMRLEELKTLLENDDGRAPACMDTIRELLRGSNRQVELDQLEQFVGNYEFEEALEVLDKISNNLSTATE